MHVLLRNDCSLKWNRSERFTLNTANAGNRLTSTVTEPNDFVLVKVVCARRTAAATAYRTSMCLCMPREWFTVEGNLLVYGMHRRPPLFGTIVHEEYQSEIFRLFLKNSSPKKKNVASLLQWLLYELTYETTAGLRWNWCTLNGSPAKQKTASSNHTNKHLAFV